MAKIVKLDRSVVQISGADARKLLHDTLSCAVSRSPDLHLQWFALLSPQGKLLFEGLLSETGDGVFFLDIASSAIADFLKRMTLYRMRADVEIMLREDLSVGWCSRQVDAARPDARPGMGFRLYADHADEWTRDVARYHSARIDAVVMEMGADFEAGTLFAHDIGMDLLHGVDFGKGCYVGQEVVSRMQHRGTARKRPVAVSGAVTAGSEIISGDRVAGKVTSASGITGIGLVRLDRIADPENCRVGEAPLRLTVPHWANYTFGAFVG